MLKCKYKLKCKFHVYKSFFFNQVLFPRVMMYTHLYNLLSGKLYVVDEC